MFYWSELENTETPVSRQRWYSKFLTGILRWLAKFPSIRRCAEQSFGGLNSRVMHCIQSADYEQAVRIALCGLEKSSRLRQRWYRRAKHVLWWGFMKQAAYAAELCENDYKQVLMRHMDSAIGPFDGYDVAYSFFMFARWQYDAGNYEKAFRYAKTATDADPTWAEADFLLGWLYLVFGHSQAEYYLRQSLSKNKGMIFRIANDEICKQYPLLMRELKKSLAAA